MALVHAKPEDGVNKLSLGITVLKDPIVLYNDTEETKYIFTLAAVDKFSHIKAMSELVTLLEDKAFYHLLERATKPTQVLSYTEQLFSD